MMCPMASRRCRNTRPVIILVGRVFPFESPRVRRLGGIVTALLMLHPAFGLAADWPQYRGPATDGVSPDRILTLWPTNGPTVVWTNTSLTNGFSSFAVSQGRAFTLISKDDGTGTLREYCVAVDAATGSNLWATPIGSEPWDPGFEGDGGAGTAPYNRGDGPRPTPSVKDGRVFALSTGNLYSTPQELSLVCLNATNGSLIWSNDLVSSYGASTIPWDNAASPCLDDDLIFVNLNTDTNNQTLSAFRTSDGSRAWSSQNERVTHATPVVATIQGVRQVIFPTQTGLVSLERNAGTFLWKFAYPFAPISTSMGASPVVYSNIVFCTAAYYRGAAAAAITSTNGAWNVTQLYYSNSPAVISPYRSIWMSPVCYNGYIYTLCGENSTFLTTPLNCIELSTGNLQWSTNGFGMGGLILVNTNLLVLTETGALVLVQPNPNAYTELARYQAFHFTMDARGKCWNSPAFSDGRIYARSTAGGLSVDVSVPQLKMLTPQILANNRLQLCIGTANSTPIDPDRFATIEVRYATNSRTTLPNWLLLTNNLVLANGMVHADNVVSLSPSFYIAVEQLTPPQLKMLMPQFLPGNRLRLWIGTTTGSRINSNRLARMEVRYATDLATSLPNWLPLANTLALTNGLVWVDTPLAGASAYYTARDLP